MLEDAIQATASARRIVIFSGAGMSADSGIGTFRGSATGYWSGLWGTFAMLWGGTPIGWRWTPSLVWSRFVTDFHGPIVQAEAHAGHTALARLLGPEEDDNTRSLFESVYVITMNVDGLHQAAGFPQDRVAEVHGSVMRYRCMSCDRKLPDIATAPLNPSSQPRCTDCGGRARPDVTLFTEPLPSDQWDSAVQAVRQLRKKDVMIVAGTSSVVYPAASLPSLAKQRGATIVEFNRDFPTPLSELADSTVEGRAVDTLPAFVQGVLDEKSKKRQQKQQQSTTT